MSNPTLTKHYEILAWLKLADREHRCHMDSASMVAATSSQALSCPS